MRVVLQGLSAKELNGKCGQVKSFDKKKQRWQVQLDDDSKGNWKALRPENLKGTEGGVALSNGEGAREGADTAMDFSDIEWARVAELSKNSVLFEVIEAGDIDQGQLGDCWLLAVLCGFYQWAWLIGHAGLEVIQCEANEGGLPVSADGGRR